jgi:hypothetical protein
MPESTVVFDDKKIKSLFFPCPEDRSVIECGIDADDEVENGMRKMDIDGPRLQNHCLSANRKQGTLGQRAKKLQIGLVFSRNLCKLRPTRAPSTSDLRLTDRTSPSIDIARSRLTCGRHAHIGLIFVPNALSIVALSFLLHSSLIFHEPQ